MNKKIYPIIPYKYIQAIRLCQSLMESNFEVCIPAIHRNKFLELEKKFSLDYSLGIKSAIQIHEIKIHHKKPLTSIGSIDRPLIYPHSILNYCYSLWNNKREIEISFAGKITPKRRTLIENYFKKKFGLILVLPEGKSTLNKILNRVNSFLGIKKDTSIVLESENFVIWSSNNGRKFPIKAWDQEYYELLSKSKFVLCPSGDFIWTYRFFETILCGAIPIVEESCKLYRDFTYYTIHDNPNKLNWTKEIIQSNYKICYDLISIPKDELNQELINIIY